MRRKKYEVKRKHSRHCLQNAAWLFGVILITAPFIVMGGPDQGKPAEATAFGLHPDVIKGAFLVLMGIISFFLIRTLNRTTANMNALHNNQRELARVLTQLATLHKVNHGQEIDLPRITGPESSE